MNITFLVGNGFDINLGLKTSYKDFCYWYIKQKSSDEDEDIEIIRECIKKDIKDNNCENWSDLEAALGEITNDFGDEDTFLKCYDDIKEKMVEYLEEEEKKFNIEKIEKKEFSNLRNGFINFYSELNQNNKDKLGYITGEKGNEDIYINFISFNFTKCLDKIISKLSQVNNQKIYRWNSNGYYKDMLLKDNVLHVHNILEDMPILAVNDESQIYNKNFLDNDLFKAEMIKKYANETVGEQIFSKTEEIINKSRIICIYGMSLGKTDARWWQYIFNWLKSNSVRKLIIYQYSDKPLSRLKIREKISRERDIIDKFLQYSDISEEDKEILIDRIFVIINTQNVLNIKMEKQTEEVTV